eukprot:595088-Hanusia_phi.AAC.4
MVLRTCWEICPLQSLVDMVISYFEPVAAVDVHHSLLPASLSSPLATSPSAHRELVVLIFSHVPVPEIAPSLKARDPTQFAQPLPQDVVSWDEVRRRKLAHPSSPRSSSNHSAYTSGWRRRSRRCSFLLERHRAQLSERDDVTEWRWGSQADRSFIAAVVRLVP